MEGVGMTPPPYALPSNAGVQTGMVAVDISDLSAFSGPFVGEGTILYPGKVIPEIKTLLGANSNAPLGLPVGVEIAGIVTEYIITAGL